MTTEEKDAEIERLRNRIADLEHASNLPRVEEIQGVYREAKLESEIERLKGELAEAVRLLGPLSRLAVKFDGILADNEVSQMGFTFGDCRSARAFLQKHTPPLNFDKRSNVDPDTLTIKNVIQEISRPAVVSAAGESPSHSGGGVKCEPDCRMCSGEYCKIHLNKPCDCDCLDRHGIFQNHQQQKPGGAS